MIPTFNQLVYRIREIALPPIQERLDLLSIQSKKEDWDLSTKLSILSNIVRDLERYNEMNPK